MDETERRLALVHPATRSEPHCHYTGCPNLPVEMIPDTEGHDRLYCEGHARLENARPAEPVLIDPLPEGALKLDGWIEGWEARRDCTQAERSRWYKEGERDGKRSAERVSLEVILLAASIACIVGFVVGFLIAVRITA